MFAYYYIKKEYCPETVECGLKLSEWFDTEAVIDDVQKKVITAYLSPKDSPKYDDENYVCLKLEIDSQKVFVAEGTYYEMNKLNWFNQSIIKADEYVIGMYRNPRFLIASTVIGDYISILNKNRDVPVLYENSQNEYIKFLTTFFEETDEKYNEKALYGYFNIKEEMGMADIVEDNEYNRVYETNNKKYIVRKPLDEKNST